MLIDCVDNFDKSVFTYNPCNDKRNLFKCEDKFSFNYGRCFNNTLIRGDVCGQFVPNTNFAYWKTNFPSQDYWK